MLMGGPLGSAVKNRREGQGASSGSKSSLSPFDLLGILVQCSLSRRESEGSAVGCVECKVGGASAGPTFGLLFRFEIHSYHLKTLTT